MRDVLAEEYMDRKWGALKCRRDFDMAERSDVKVTYDHWECNPKEIGAAQPDSSEVVVCLGDEWVDGWMTEYFGGWMSESVGERCVNKKKMEWVEMVLHGLANEAQMNFL